MLLRVGTRGSKLSLVQTDIVLDRLKRANPELNLEKRIITTKGDEDTRTPIFSLNQKGIFEKEIDQAVLERRIDVAVHSLKDIPVFDQDTDLVIASVPERGSPSDVLITRDNRKLKGLKMGSRIGTSSLLRVAQLKRARPDLQADPIRGNVDTRIQKVDSGEYDAVILAEAGLARLGMTGRISEKLPLKEFIPAPGQGALGLVARRDDAKVLEVLKMIEHYQTRAEADAERELVKTLEGGCKVPIGALASAAGEKLRITGHIYSIDGKERLDAMKAGNIKDATTLGRSVADELISKGAKRLEESWRGKYR